MQACFLFQVNKRTNIYKMSLSFFEWLPQWSTQFPSYLFINLKCENFIKKFLDLLKNWLINAILEINFIVLFLFSVIHASIHDVLLFSFTAKTYSLLILPKHHDLVSFVISLKKTITALPVSSLTSSTTFNTIKDPLILANYPPTWKIPFEPESLLNKIANFLFNQHIIFS